MLPPWMTPSKPKPQGEHAFGRDPDASENGMHGEILYLLVVAAIVWLVAVAFFAILLQSAAPVVVGVALPAAGFFAGRALLRRLRSRS